MKKKNSRPARRSAAPGTRSPDPARAAAGSTNGLLRPTDRRELRIFAADPSLGASLGTFRLAEIVTSIQWETLEPGPRGAHLAVIDRDPIRHDFHVPADLEAPEVIATRGYRPDEADPRFHHQMVYAVIMKTIERFEDALGRPVLWNPPRRATPEASGKSDEPPAALRLHVYPHALTEPNAFYDPTTCSLLFGCFPIPEPGGKKAPSPGSTVFTCLSHDIVVHETVHAILDGIHPRYIEATNPDVRAFHEGFADVVALFSKMDHVDLVAHAIRATRGRLSSDTLLSQIAVQFGEAVGQRGPLRSAIGRFDRDTDQWVPRPPDPTELDRASECHDRGEILVAAIFDAFLAIFRERSTLLFEIAQVDPADVRPERFTPALVTALTERVQEAARTILNICIRALDYCPPVDLTFGDYLRALITADIEAVRNDTREYRVALIEAFRRRGIFPSGRRILSEQSLLWLPPNCPGANPNLLDLVLGKKVCSAYLKTGLLGHAPRSGESSSLSEPAPIDPLVKASADSKRLAAITHGVLKKWSESATPEQHRDFTQMTGLVLSDPNFKFEVHAVRPIRRVTPSGRILHDLLVEITQWLPMFDEGYPPLIKLGAESNSAAKLAVPFRGGCTLIIDASNGHVRYSVYKRINSLSRYDEQREFLLGEEESEFAAIFGSNGHFFRALHAEAEHTHDLYHAGEVIDAQ